MPVEEGMIRTVTLEVGVLRGSHMPKMDNMGGTCDAFCRLEYSSEVMETKPDKRTYEPVWDDRIPFRPVALKSTDTPDPGKLVVRVLNFDDIGASDLVGLAVLSAEFMKQVVRPPVSRASHSSCAPDDGQGSRC